MKAYACLLVSELDIIESLGEIDGSCKTLPDLCENGMLEPVAGQTFYWNRGWRISASCLETTSQTL